MGLLLDCLMCENTLKELDAAKLRSCKINCQTYQQVLGKKQSS